ncbi:MAG: hypothetical protein KGL58_06180 [Pseudomonadota bacterium]|nr:hypothetical protein [Pseudomonadota bacterium]
MNADWIRSNLIYWLKKNNSSHAEIKAYEKHLDSLGSMSGYPCPNCFVNNGEEHALMVLGAHTGIQPIVCGYCNITFLIPD